MNQDFIDCVADVCSVFGDGVRISHLTLCQIPGFQMGATTEEQDREVVEAARRENQRVSP